VAKAKTRSSCALFGGWTILRLEGGTLRAAWAAYERDGNKVALTNQHALFFRTTFAPTLAGALAGDGAAERSRAFTDRLESGLQRRLASQPQPINSLVETMVLAKVARQRSRIQKTKNE
jgi:hypothetical protein